MVWTTRHSTPVLATLAAITLLACGAWPTDTPGPPVSLSISPTELSLVVGGEGRLTAQAIDKKGRITYPLIEWSSADPAVATIRKSDGTVTAIALSHSDGGCGPNLDACHTLR